MRQNSNPGRTTAGGAGWKDSLAGAVGGQPLAPQTASRTAGGKPEELRGPPGRGWDTQGGPGKQEVRARRKSYSGVGNRRALGGSAL
jgi:hypothetical protein